MAPPPLRAGQSHLAIPYVTGSVITGESRYPLRRMTIVGEKKDGAPALKGSRLSPGRRIITSIGIQMRIPCVQGGRGRRQVGNGEGRRRRQMTRSFFGSMRCIWLRSAESRAVSPALAGGRGIDAGADLNAIDDEIDERLHAHGLDYVDRDLELGMAGCAAGARLGDVLGAQAEKQLATGVGPVARGAARRVPGSSGRR